MVLVLTTHTNYIGTAHSEHCYVYIAIVLLVVHATYYTKLLNLIFYCSTF